MTAPNIVQVANINGEASVVTTLDTTAKIILFNEASSGKVIKLNQIVATNVDGTNSADVTIQLSRAGTTYSIVKTVAVPADSSLVVLSKEIGIYLEEEDAITGFASAAGDLDVTCSYEVIAESENIITTRGLKLYYDPGDDNSYPNSGTTLKDLSPNAYNGTLTSPSFSTEGGGSFAYDGTASNTLDVNIPSFFSSFSTDKITMSTWIYIPTSATWTNTYYGGIFTRGTFAGAHGLWRTSVNNQIAFYCRENESGNAIQSIYNTISRDTWYHVVGVWDNGTYLYVNGSLVDNDSDTLGLGTVEDTADFTIGSIVAAGGSNGNAFEGKQTLHMIYDRALSATEIARNYNAQKGRFGL